jgi:hypothetical protein
MEGAIESAMMLERLVFWRANWLGKIALMSDSVKSHPTPISVEAIQSLCGDPTAIVLEREVAALWVQPPRVSGQIGMKSAFGGNKEVK